MPNIQSVYLFEIERLSISFDEFNFKVRGYKAIQADSVDAAYSELIQMDIAQGDIVNCMWTGSFTLDDYVSRVQHASEQQKNLERLYKEGRHTEVISHIKYLMAYGYRIGLNKQKDQYIVSPLFDTTFVLKEK